MIPFSPRWLVRFAAWLVAANLVAIGTHAPTAGAQSAVSPSRLQPLVNDAVAQLQLSYRFDAAERQQRYELIGRAVAAWNQSKRSAADNELLADWLRRAMRASMPGSREPLPSLPEFDRPIAAEAPIQAAPSPAAEENKESKRDDASSATHAAQSTESVPAESAGETESRPVTSPPGEASADQHSQDTDEGDPFRDDPLPEQKEHLPEQK
jgi:hypothetical protein